VAIIGGLLATPHESRSLVVASRVDEFAILEGDWFLRLDRLGTDQTRLSSHAIPLMKCKAKCKASPR